MKKESSNNLKSLLSGIVGAIIVIFFFFIIGLPNPLNSNVNKEVQPVNTADETTIGRIYNDTVDSVISVVNSDNPLIQRYVDSQTNGEPIKQGVGSGFVYKEADDYYYAVTNNHVVDGSDEIGIITNETSQEDGELIDAELLGSSPNYDVAVIRFKTDEDIKVLEFADSDMIYPGEAVYAIGSPYGTDFQGSITSGIVSAPIRTFENTVGNNMQYIQTDAAINPGNSGGPLLNSDGEVIGMNTLKIAELEADNMGFSIPSNVVKEIVKAIEDTSTEPKNSQDTQSESAIFSKE